MDTEKKVQFVALTKEEIDAMIQQAALAGAQVASDAMMVGQRKSEKEKIDRRLHNTDLLLRNYRTLKASYENAVYKSKEGEVTEVLEDIMRCWPRKRQASCGRQKSDFFKLHQYLEEDKLTAKNTSNDGCRVIRKEPNIAFSQTLKNAIPLCHMIKY